MNDEPHHELVVSDEAVPESTIVWRYFSFERFTDLLKTQSLWFSRPFAFDDLWEGLFPPSYLKRTRQYCEQNNLSFDEFDQEFTKRRLLHRCAHFVNCWHMSQHESDAMWKLYSVAPEGIAIQSTVGDINECLRPHGSGKVIYYDPSHDVISPTIFGPNDILFKRSAFSFELEYRFWFDDDELLERIDAGEAVSETELSRGSTFEIDDMQRLIKKIVVAPGATDEFIQQVRTTCGTYRMQWLWSFIERSYSDRMWESFTK